MEKNTVVIIDDDEDLLKLLVQAFKSKNHEVETFVNGKDALSFLNNQKKIKEVCLIVLDRILPDMDGIEILNKLKEKASFDIPVLILSVLSSEKDVLSGLKHGAIDYVPKPFSLPIFMQKAEKLIKG